MIFFYKESKSKKKEILFFFVWGWVGEGGSEVAKLSDFFTKNPNLKKKLFFGGGGGGVGGGGSRISEFFLQRIQIYNCFFFLGGGGRWTDRPKPICQFSSSRTTTVQNYFEIHALMYMLWPGQAQNMTTLTII